ncbi:hypothetical protein NPX13_g9292 [Xylaria arbuscula]|uniref:Uncharacterized protein n=1 Tax=Xylaria arbuscula TaxID=114810 RepID=A0A9W8N6Y7_9PEZI|nr:hypothetical protein NPX13_g9292 [Xylaria arbuscula]
MPKSHTIRDIEALGGEHLVTQPSPKRALSRNAPIRHPLRLPPRSPAARGEHLLPGHHLHPPFTPARHRAPEAAAARLQVSDVAAPDVEIGRPGVAGGSAVGVARRIFSRAGAFRVVMNDEMR